VPPELITIAVSAKTVVFPITQSAADDPTVPFPICTEPVPDEDTRLKHPATPLAEAIVDASAIVSTPLAIVFPEAARVTVANRVPVGTLLPTTGWDPV
jgi:hypothetical protein